MPAFVWEARTRAGEVKSGTMVADTIEAVQQRLRQQSLQPQSVKKQPMQLQLKLPQFGSGVHACLGSHLARLQAERFLGAILRRLDSVEIVGEPVWSTRMVIRGLASLPIRCTITAG